MSSRSAFEAARWRALLTGILRCGASAGLGCAMIVSLRASPPVDPAPAAPPSHDLADPAQTADPTPADEAAVFKAISGEVAKIFAKSRDAVVRIEATDDYGVHAGTGFLIDMNGTIFTHCSVAGHGWNILVAFANKKYPATCLMVDPRSGVTLLHIEAGQTPFLPLGRSEDLKIASPVVVIGYPMEAPASPTFGLVAGFDQKCFGRFLPTTHIRANVPVQSGEQGGPLLNAKGEVVGILVCQYDYGAICLSLPIQAAEKVRANYLRFGDPRPGWIGVTAKPAGEDEENGAVRVDGLAEDSPAAHSGLQNGDILLRVGRTAIHRFADLRDASFYLTAEEKVPILVQRGDKEITVETRAADPPGASRALPPQLKSGIEDGETRLALPSAR